MQKDPAQMITNVLVSKQHKFCSDNMGQLRAWASQIEFEGFVKNKGQVNLHSQWLGIAETCDEFLSDPECPPVTD